MVSPPKPKKPKVSSYKHGHKKPKKLKGVKKAKPRTTVLGS